ncbi:helix-turn-helix domain-containing protein [Halorussus gelatinilyticus]|uniref:Helix-turn-helix domain-containing protein n=1 Tax=Halorussus gelatinilyticus TaxID=2937524 RepID=A0A8U0IDY7_9EURY|nr:bacterio-opsin activator domain-containing protein [Halorussus gelatinilyticus]UPV99137.1 helix-turn-helix domain-containing protein [Halorussus gelatinilyticus]
MELEFEMSDSELLFVAASDAEQCLIELEEMIPRGEGQYAEFFSVADTDPADLLDLADDHGAVEPHLIEASEDDGLVEFSVSADCPAVSLAESGALPRVVRAETGDGRIVAELPPRHAPAEVVESFLDEYPSAEFVAKREKESVTTPFGSEGFEQLLREHLTDRQREVLRAAYEAGYYDWPRDCTGEEVARELDITSATFSQHIHAAERKLLAALFEGSRTESNSTGMQESW